MNAIELMWRVLFATSVAGNVLILASFVGLRKELREAPGRFFRHMFGDLLKNTTIQFDEQGRALVVKPSGTGDDDE